MLIIAFLPNLCKCNPKEICTLFTMQKYDRLILYWIRSGSILKKEDKKGTVYVKSD